MLQLKNISRIYKTDDIEMKALDGVSTSFRKSEFVSILGPSGSGKTTLLNIIGGLDHYTSGDIIIDGISTKKYTDRDWDAYRNHRIGFIFQSYNLIGHQSILSNVELALTLSGVSGNRRKKLATEALEKVGLKTHINKRPSQLSGGQMQRVAIARALVNNPDIILADEPTGALDSKTSVQIMDLLKDIAKDKLVIMVTHNPDLAKTYSTRIIEVKDGKIVADSKPFDNKTETEETAAQPQHTSMSLLTALQLSKNNLLLKRGRTFLTALAGSIGIIGIAIILALANGVNNYADKMLSSGSVPSAITISRTYTDNSSSTLFSSSDDKTEVKSGTLLGTDDISSNSLITHQKTVRYYDTKSLKSYLDATDTSAYVDTINYSYNYTPDIYTTTASGNRIQVHPIENELDSITSLFASASRTTTDVATSDILKSSFKEIASTRSFDLLEGKLPESKTDLLLILDSDAKIPLSVLYTLDLLSRDELAATLTKLNSGESASFKSQTINLKDVLGKTYEVDFLDGTKSTLTITGVAKAKDASDDSQFLGYTHALIESGIKHSAGTYDLDTPEAIAIYPKTNADKDKIKSLLDAYNQEHGTDIAYSDVAQLSIDLVKNIVNILSYVLIAFVAISLIVSSIMIGIITYISVLERTKEIGILRAIGASKKDVVRVFRAETIIEGSIAGILGILFSEFFILLANAIISLFKLADGLTVQLSLTHALILITISILLTVIAGSAPARRASRKDPVEALRTE